MTSAPPPRPPIEPSLVTAPEGWRVEVLGEVASTNEALAERARAGESAGTVLVAEHQTAGRGRLDRTWETPARAALTFSVLLRPEVAAERWPWLPLLTGLGVVDGINAVGGPACALKWPNDVLHDGLKLGGLLAERVHTPAGPAVVLGIGLNVTTVRAELPVDTATSLLLAGWRGPDRVDLLSATLGALAVRYAGWVAGRSVREAYVGRCATLGQEVRVHLPGGVEMTGTAADVDEDGGLVVETAKGPVAVSAGDVVHVRPAP